jgi:hypothetical protein
VTWNFTPPARLGTALRPESLKLILILMIPRPASPNGAAASRSRLRQLPPVLPPMLSDAQYLDSSPSTDGEEIKKLLNSTLEREKLDCKRTSLIYIHSLDANLGTALNQGS